MAERKKLYLERSSLWLKEPHFFVPYGLCTNLDKAEEPDYAFLLDFVRGLGTRLFAGMTVFTRSWDRANKEPRKRWLLPDRPAHFSENTFVAALEGKIAKGELDYACFTWEGWVQYESYRRYEKEFYMSSPCYTEQFFMECLEEKNYFSSVPYDFFLAGYRQEEAQKFSSLGELVVDLHRENRTALICDGDSLDGKIHFSVNPRQYDTADFCKLVQETAEAFGRELEIVG